MRAGKIFGAILILGATLVALSACQKQEGPLERAGKDLDKAAQSVGEQVEKAGESIQDAAKGDQK